MGELSHYWASALWHRPWLTSLADVSFRVHLVANLLSRKYKMTHFKETSFFKSHISKYTWIGSAKTSTLLNNNDNKNNNRDSNEEGPPSCSESKDSSQQKQNVQSHLLASMSYDRQK